MSAGIPEDVAALIFALTEAETVVTLVNLNKTEAPTVIVQGGAYGEHRIESVAIGPKTTSINSASLTVILDPGAGERLTLRMKRYANPPTIQHPYHPI
jgi:hypothetical protein